MKIGISGASGQLGKEVLAQLIARAFRAGQSVMQEFFFKRFTKNVPDPNSSTNSQATAPSREVSSTL